MNKLTRARSEFASQFIDNVADQTTLEGLHSLMRKEYFENTPGTFGERTLECQQAFANKYVEIADTEEEIIIGTISFRGGWYSGSYGYWAKSSVGKVVFNIQKHITCIEFPNKASKDEWEDALSKHEETLITAGHYVGSLWVHPTYHRHPSLCERISQHYSFCRPINPKIAQNTIIALVKKLTTYRGCLLAYQMSHNFECGEILIRSMYKHAKTKEEVFFVLNSLFNKKPGNTPFAKEIKILAKKFHQLL